MENTTPNLQIGVKALIKHDNKYLLVKRSGKYAGLEGLWDIVGGRIHFGETLEDGLKREIYEETRLNVPRVTSIVLGAQDIIKVEKNLHVVRISYLVELADVPHVTLDGENTEFGWFTLAEILEKEGIDLYLQEVVLKNKEIL